MKISELVAYCSPTQQVIVWSDRFVEVMYHGYVEDMSKTVLSQDVQFIGGSFTPNTIRIVID